MAVRLAVANGGAVLAAFFGLLWVVIVTCGFTWISSVSILVDFHVTILSVTATEGTITGLVKLTAKMFKPHKRFFKSFFGKTIWLEDVRDTFCAGLGKTLQWCDMWEMVIYSSYFMCFAGVVCGITLASGGFLVYYYANNHATESGRLAARYCFIGAPVLALLGLLQYTGFTQEFGQMSAVDMGPMKAQSMYGAGYLFAWVLFIFSWVPLYMLTLFLRGDALEKRHWDAEEKEAIFGDQKQPAQGYTTFQQPQPQVTVMAGPGVDFGVGVAGPSMMGPPPVVVSTPVVTSTPIMTSTPVMMSSTPIAGPEITMVQTSGPMPMPAGPGPQAWDMPAGPGPQGPQPGFGGAAW